jgi:hypothetical protein
VIKNNSIERIAVRNIWNGYKPTLDNLLEFLKMPSMLKGFYENIGFLYRPIIRIQESNENLSVLDYYLEKNPYEEYFKLTIDERTNNFNKNNNSNGQLNKSKKKKRQQVKKVE